MFVHLDGVRVNELGSPHDAFVRRPFLNIAHDKTDKAVALGFHTAHDFCTVNANRTLNMYAKRCGVLRLMRGFSRSNQ